MRSKFLDKIFFLEKMKTMKMYIFIINSVSGNGKALKVWKQIKIELEKQKVQYRSFFTKHAGHAEEIAEQVAELHQDKIESIIAVGGDGTIHEVINGLEAYPKVSVGYIPGGSGNDFARGFLIPKSPLKALKKILSEQGRRPKRYDMGRYQFLSRKKAERFFVNGLGIGFDGEVAKVTNESGYKAFLNRIKCGGLAYTISLVRLLFSYEPREIEVHIDGVEKRFSGVWLVAISNIAYYGGGMKISPHAKPNDGKLNLCIVHQLSKWKLLFIFSTVFFGKHIRFRGVTLLEGREIEVRSVKPMTIHADGEIIGTTPISINIDEDSRFIC
jgi:diacylglycerol kinase (ATP)